MQCMQDICHTSSFFSFMMRKKTHTYFFPVVPRKTYRLRSIYTGSDFLRWCKLMFVLSLFFVAFATLLSTFVFCALLGFSRNTTVLGRFMANFDFPIVPSLGSASSWTLISLQTTQNVLDERVYAYMSLAAQ